MEGPCTVKWIKPFPTPRKTTNFSSTLNEIKALRAAKTGVVFCSQNNVHALNKRRDVVGLVGA